MTDLQKAFAANETVKRAIKQIAIDEGAGCFYEPAVIKTTLATLTIFLQTLPEEVILLWIVTLLDCDDVTAREKKNLLNLLPIRE